MKNEIKNDMKFEAALERLEEIVSKLEDGSLSLDDALKSYEEGVKLARLCTKQLTEAEKKIEILTKALGGELEAVPFDTEDYKNESGETADGSPSKGKPKGRKKSGTDDSEESSLF